jgi:CcmD family protein
MIKFLYLAYAVTWLIHLAYLAVLGQGFKRVKEELRELEEKNR